MATPAMVFACLLKLMAISVGVFWSVSFAASRLFVFYETYTAFVRVLEDEEWLRIQCALPEFYANLRQHTDLCNSVRLNAERSPFLIALNAVANTAHLCGRYTCMEALSMLGWPALLAIAAVLLVAPSVLLRLARAAVLHEEPLMPTAAVYHHPYDSRNLKYM